MFYSRHNTAEILIKLALNTNLSIYFNIPLFRVKQMQYNYKITNIINEIHIHKIVPICFINSPDIFINFSALPILFNISEINLYS